MNVRLCGLVADFVGNFVAVLDDVVLSSCGDSNSHAAEDEKEEPDGEHNDAVTDRVAAALAAAEEEAKDGDDDDKDGEAIEEDGHEFGSGVQITHRFRVFQVVEDSRIRSEHAEDEHDDAFVLNSLCKPPTSFVVSPVHEYVVLVRSSFVGCLTVAAFA